MLELKHFKGDYNMIRYSSMSYAKMLEVVHKLIKDNYSHISEECYAWLFSLEDD